MTAKPAILAIYIKGKLTPQGKIFQQDGRWIFLVNIDENKWWKNYSGYSIASQILETFSKAKIKPRIVYRWTEKNLLYETNKTTFLKKGIPVSYGDHRQIVLPILNWKTFKGKLTEPFSLSEVSVGRWGNSVVSTGQRETTDCSMPVNVFAELKRRHPEILNVIRDSRRLPRRLYQ